MKKKNVLNEVRVYCTLMPIPNRNFRGVRTKTRINSRLARVSVGSFWTVNQDCLVSNQSESLMSHLWSVKDNQRTHSKHSSQHEEGRARKCPLQIMIIAAATQCHAFPRSRSNTYFHFRVFFPFNQPRGRIYSQAKTCAAIFGTSVSPQNYNSPH